jgi:hypothetical protein
MKAGREETHGACLRFDRELEGYLEGESRPFLTAHAQDCRSCRALLSDLELIRLAAREMPWEDPSPVVWANVRARLEAEGAFRPQSSCWRTLLSWWAIPHPVPIAALAGLVILGSLLSMPPRSAQRWDAPEAPPASPSITASTATPPSEDGALAGLVQELESNYRAKEASLAPDVKATYNKSLVSLNDSIRECLDCLQHEPRNTLAHEYLLTAYTRKAEILSFALESEGR